MLTIINPETHRQTDYSRDYLTREARRLAKSVDGKLRAWRLVVIDNRASGVSLRVDYLRRDGTAAVTSCAL